MRFLRRLFGSGSQPTQPNPQPEKVRVKWNGSWWPATIIDRKGQLVYVHYDGWESRWDEWVTPDRVRRPEPAVTVPHDAHEHEGQIKACIPAVPVPRGAQKIQDEHLGSGCLGVLLYLGATGLFFWAAWLGLEKEWLPLPLVCIFWAGIVVGILAAVLLANFARYPDPNLIRLRLACKTGVSNYKVEYPASASPFQPWRRTSWTQHYATWDFSLKRPPNGPKRVELGCPQCGATFRFRVYNRRREFWRRSFWPFLVAVLMSMILAVICASVWEKQKPPTINPVPKATDARVAATTLQGGPGGEESLRMFLLKGLLFYGCLGFLVFSFVAWVAGFMSIDDADGLSNDWWPMHWIVAWNTDGCHELWHAADSERSAQ